MIGEDGTAEVAVDPDGVVLIRGARWRARTNRATPIQAGDPVKVVAVEGLVLEVEPPEGGAQDYRERAREPAASRDLTRALVRSAIQPSRFRAARHSEGGGGPWPSTHSTRGAHVRHAAARRPRCSSRRPAPSAAKTATCARRGPRRSAASARCSASASTMRSQFGEAHGIWGGLNEHERRQLLEAQLQLTPAARRRAADRSGRHLYTVKVTVQVMARPA